MIELLYFIAHKINKNEINDNFEANFSKNSVEIDETYTEFCNKLVETTRDHSNRVVGEINKQNNPFFDDLDDLILEAIENEIKVRQDSLNTIAERLTNILITLQNTLNAKSVGYLIISYFDYLGKKYMGVFKISDNSKAYNFEQHNKTHELVTFNHLNIKDLTLGCIISLEEISIAGATPITMISSLSKMPPNYFINLIGLVDHTNSANNTTKIQNECYNFYEENKSIFIDTITSKEEFKSRTDEALFMASKVKSKDHTSDLSIDIIKVIAPVVCPEDESKLDEYLRQSEKKISPSLPINKGIIQKSQTIEIKFNGIKLIAPINEVNKHIYVELQEDESYNIILANVPLSEIEHYL